MKAIVLQTKREKGTSKVYFATAIGPFETFDDADNHATALCRKSGDDYLYNVLTLEQPVETQ